MRYQCLVLAAALMTVQPAQAQNWMPDPSEKLLPRSAEQLDAIRALAETGDADAWLELADRYRTGAGLPCDAVEAHAAYNIAAALTVRADKASAAAKASWWRDQMALRMSRTEVATAEAVATEWVRLFDKRRTEGTFFDKLGAGINEMTAKLRDGASRKLTGPGGQPE